MLSKFLAACSLCVVIYVSSSSLAIACKCARPKPPLQYINQVDAAFIGEVTKVKKSNYRNIVKMRVIKSWKGIDKKNVTIDTGMGGGDCGFYFIDKQQYLVYAKKKGNVLKTGICMRTKPIDQAQKEIEILSKRLDKD